MGFNLSSKRDNGKNLKGLILKDNSIIRFASRMDQLPPYLFGMVNKLKMEKGVTVMMLLTLVWEIPWTPPRMQ